ncbi:MAG TPA: hypothetical protein VK172_04260 [Lentimicrobium sp.]|nr:hypothetical protein [Lentimicrobium sp.]
MTYRIIASLLILTACQRHINTPQPNPSATQAVIEFNLDKLNFKKSIELLPSGDSISKTALLVTPAVYDSIMQGINISEPLDRKHHYVTVFFLDKDLHKDSLIRYENILGFGIYTIKRTIMHYKLFVKKENIHTPIDDFTCTAQTIYCLDNNIIARHFIKLYKKPVTWLPIFDQKKDRVILSRHELTERLNQLIKF